MKNDMGKFRFTYFTEKYYETFRFYQESLSLKLEHSWDRSPHDKGALFKAGDGLIEILFNSKRPEQECEGLDYRSPQGVFMCIQVWNVDELFKEYSQAGIPFKQTLTDQEWGHRSFSIIEPNGLVLFFFQEQF